MMNEWNSKTYKLYPKATFKQIFITLCGWLVGWSGAFLKECLFAPSVLSFPLFICTLYDIDVQLRRCEVCSRALHFNLLNSRYCNAMHWRKQSKNNFIDNGHFGGRGLLLLLSSVSSASLSTRLLLMTMMMPVTMMMRWPTILPWA